MDRMTITTPTDDDLIRRGDALEAIKAHSLRAPMATVDTAAFLIRALPVQPAPVAVEPATPAAKWRVNGEPDPQGTRYDCERAKLAKGDLTDDELANAIYMADRNSLDLIVWQTAAKDRIRWLSRALEAAITARPVAEVQAEAVAVAFAAAAKEAEKLAAVTSEDRYWGVNAERFVEQVTAKALAKSILALTPTDAQAALDRLIRDAEIRGQAKGLREADALFVTSGAEQAYIDAGEVACPACGGSGHKDDAAAALDRIRAATREAELREALAAIAALARGASVETVQGQEQAYNAILALIEEQKE